MRALVVFLVVAVAVAAAMPGVDEKSKVDNSLTEVRPPPDGLASLPNGGRQGRCCGWRGYGMYGGYGMGMGMGYGGLYGGMGYGGMGYGGLGYGGLYGGMGYGLYGRR